MNPRTWIVPALLVCGLALGQPPAEPTQFEAFATQANAQIVLEQKVGTIESTDAKLQVTALIVNESDSSSKQMRGARLDFENNTAADHVFLDRRQLASLRKDLAGLEAGIPMLRQCDSPYCIQGTQSCWLPEQRVRILCPAYTLRPDGAAFDAGALGGPEFTFPNQQPAALLRLVEEALARTEKRSGS